MIQSYPAVDIGEVGDTEPPSGTCWHLDACQGWWTLPQPILGSDEQRIAELVPRLRDVVAAELLTESIGV